VIYGGGAGKFLQEMLDASNISLFSPPVPPLNT
jgi:hypothetical protein